MPPSAQSLEGRLPCDAWHHHYHYQSSAQYLWLAETLRALGLKEEMLAAYERAIFQDHFNEEALAGKKDTARTARVVPQYDKHPLYDREFRSLIGELPDETTKPHDDAAAALLEGDISAALSHLKKAITAAPDHSNSYFARGKCHFLGNRFEEARADFAEAIRLSHQRHDAYHHAASAEHVTRGHEFLKKGALDLAINDFTKALDLWRANKDALLGRAETYHAKGNTKLAEADEEAVRRLG